MNVVPVNDSESSTDAEVAAAAVAERLHWRLFRLTSSYRRREQEQVADGALTLTQCSMLYVLGEHGPLRIGELAAIEGVTAPTTTQAVARLEKLGLVDRLRDPLDHRIVRVQITDAGHELQRSASERVLKVMLDELGPHQIGALEIALDSLEQLTRALSSSAALSPGMPL